MIHENIELYNTAETFSSATGGIGIQRVPEAIRRELNPVAQMRVRQPENCEIRFVSDSLESSVTLSSEGVADVTVFYGSFDGQDRYTIGQQPTTIPLQPPKRLQQLKQRWWRDHAFSPHVRRLIFGGRNRDPMIFHKVTDEGIRPPTAQELPKLRYLSYGTSITQGFDSAGPHLSNVAQTAHHLQADLINLGVGGSCHCERAFADHIAKRTDWDIATLELSVNMQQFSLEEFQQRTKTLIYEVAKSQPNKIIACITLFPYLRDFSPDNIDETFGGRPEDFRQIIRDAVEACPYPHVHLIEGDSLLTNIGGLTGDLIHPSDHAMIEIGINLAARLRSFLTKGHEFTLPRKL
jgi:hypothetical protein